MIGLIIKAILIVTIVYTITYILSRLLGRKLISQLNFFDFVLGVIIGNTAGNAMSLEEDPSLTSFIALMVICIITLILDIFHLSSLNFHKFINSEPIVVIEKGKIIDQNLKRARLSIDELNMLLRDKNYFNLSDVESAIFETSGKLSVQAKSEKQPLTPSDINITPAYKGLTRDVVMEGNILEENLNYIGKNESWLKKQLKSYGVHDISEVFYAGLDSSGNFYVSKKGLKKEEQPGQHGIE